MTDNPIIAEWQRLYAASGHPFRGLTIAPDGDGASIACDGIEVTRVVHEGGKKPWKLYYRRSGAKEAYSTLNNLFEGNWIHSAPGLAEDVREQQQRYEARAKERAKGR